MKILLVLFGLLFQVSGNTNLLQQLLSGLDIDESLELQNSILTSTSDANYNCTNDTCTTGFPTNQDEMFTLDDATEDYLLDKLYEIFVDTTRSVGNNFYFFLTVNSFLQ